MRLSGSAAYVPCCLPSVQAVWHLSLLLPQPPLNPRTGRAAGAAPHGHGGGHHRDARTCDAAGGVAGSLCVKQMCWGNGI